MLKIQNNRHLDLKRDIIDDSDKVSNKMYGIMSKHYQEIKKKVGLTGKKVQRNDIFNDPVPFSEQYPSVVVQHMEDEKF